MMFTIDHPNSFVAQQHCQLGLSTKLVMTLYISRLHFLILELTKWKPTKTTPRKTKDEIGRQHCQTHWKEIDDIS